MTAPPVLGARHPAAVHWLRKPDGQRFTEVACGRALDEVQFRNNASTDATRVSCRDCRERIAAERQQSLFPAPRQ